MNKNTLFIISIVLIILFSTSLTGCNHFNNNVVDLFKASDAISLVLKDQPEFPNTEGEINTLEVITGGIYPGYNVKADLTTEVSEKEENKYIVKLTKKWNIELNGKQPISYWIYLVEPNYIALIESVDMDYMISIIK